MATPKNVDDVEVINGNRLSSRILATTLALTLPTAAIPDVHPTVQSPTDDNDGPMPSSVMATPENVDDEDGLSESGNIIYLAIHKQMKTFSRAVRLMKGRRQLRRHNLYDQWRR
ncbi:uncharacterized protein LOC121389778 [Gigantopelta aegis]|uniref:uncharacterized protein LOC121389778 n=1 Tax=Gigantopelta aegis TaxID=1735272 RepID=UPI001B88B2FC|nr:uncharacterized protein LOC121389778 [Gigantopelta aegis]